MENNNPGVTTGKGIVVIMDAVGTKDLNTEGCIKFFETRSQLLNELSANCQAIIRGKPTSRVKYDFVHHLVSFADTVVLAIEIKGFTRKRGSLAFPTGNPEDDLAWYGACVRKISPVLSRFIRNGLSRGMAFRGALSIGEFIVDEKSSSILGPAINDAAQWYDQFSGFGINLTPHTALAIASITNNEKELYKDEFKENKECIFTDITLKDNSKIKMYSINWPSAYYTDQEKSLTAFKSKSIFLKDIFGFNIPIGTENKYNSAIDFFMEVIEKYPRS
jgi:hypothetical protein